MAKKPPESTAVAYVILGIVAIMAIVGLVLLFKSGATGQAASHVSYEEFMDQPGSGAIEERYGPPASDWVAQERAKLASYGKEAQRD
ncbi:hypothetical protein HY486_04950 [Candidatus Woesearchaeota archaeon]|nr:hypothetical protein [Candidatus Woesearchaeota archaeon]